MPEFTATLLYRLHAAHKLVRDHLDQAAEASSHWYNRSVKLKSFCVGDIVRVYNPRRFKGRTPKWQLFYREQDTITRKLNDVTYVVSSPAWKQDKVFHVDKLKFSQSFKSSVDGFSAHSTTGRGIPPALQHCSDSSRDC